MNNITELKTKPDEVQPSKVSVTPTSVQKAMSSGGPRMTEVMARPWRLVGDCSKHVQLPRETQRQSRNDQRDLLMTNLL